VAQLFSLGHITRFLKTNIILPVILLIIIAILGGALGYEIPHRSGSDRDADIKQAREQGFRSGLRAGEQVIINMNVQAYHDLESGNIDGLKRSIVTFLANESYNYTLRYGPEKSTNFVTILAEAKAIGGKSNQTNK